MIDLATQSGLNPKEAAAYLPSYKSGKPPHPSKIIRLIVKGTKLPDGSLIRLEALRIGNQWITTVEAIQAYGERVAAAMMIGGDIAPAKPVSQNRQADRELVANGF